MTLTREEILALTSGSQLSALVAEIVMEYVWIAPKYAGEQGYWWSPKSCKEVFIFNPSKDISAAWEVADELKIAIIPQSSSAPDNLKYLARAEWDFRQKEIDVFAATAPEAISKVALLMVLKL
ncbi:BC1872 family protein [Paenibacillus sp. FSL R10-2771]|uniref:BC1872 family protein n=1 Tax=Paenibacillus sp. FSL R10-2771 TaxID=2954693 RepID=UPI0030F743AB